MKLYLIRHGETPWTLSGQHTGRSDIEMTDKGRQDARKMGVWLRDQEIVFDKVFSSPSKRAQETCQLAGFSEKAVVTPDLAEWNYGDYEGLTSSQIHEKDPSWSVFTKGAPHGESVDDVTARAKRALDLVQNIDGNAAFFSSAHFLRALTAVWLKFTAAEGRCFLLLPASLSILGYERKSPVILLWNSTNLSS